jgi:PAS domain S-box-containing protein
LQSKATHATSDDGKSDRRSKPLRRIATAWRSPSSLVVGIGWRLLVRVLLFSSVITLLLTMMELYLDYRRDVQTIDLRMSEIHSGYRRSLGDGLWRVDQRQLQLQVEGIFHLPDISYVELREATDRAAPLLVAVGSHQANPPARREFRIFYGNHDAEQLLGILTIEATFDQIYRRLFDTAVIIMVGQAIKTFIVSFFILLLVHRLITRPLTEITTSLREYDLRGQQAPLRLERSPPRPADELDQLVRAFNQMYARLQVAHHGLEEREAKIRRLVEANIIGIFIFDSEDRIVEANDAFLQIVGYNRDDLVAGRVRSTNLTPPEWRDRRARATTELKITGAVQPYEREYFRKDSSRVPALIGSAAFDERRDQGVTFVLDLTERRRAEEALRKMQIELAHANRVATMGQLTASIAHEVKQPITSAAAYANAALHFLARTPPKLEKMREALEGIVAASRRAGEVIDRVRTLVRKEQPRSERFDINEAIREVIELMRGEAVKNDVSVQTDLAHGLPVIQGDRVQLQQVILNLIMNAVESMSSVSDGTRALFISTSNAEADGLLVSISDSGPGLPPTNLADIFDAFYTTKASGLGMGLSICRSIVDAHGGRLWATPNEPHGAVFRIMLPIRKNRDEKSSGT